MKHCFYINFNPITILEVLYFYLALIFKKESFKGTSKIENDTYYKIK